MRGELDLEADCDVGDYHPAYAKAIEGLIEGLAADCGRHIGVSLRGAPTAVRPFVWSIG